MICDKCGCSAVVNNCPMCGAPYMNQATKDYLNSIEVKKSGLTSKGYYLSSKDKQKEKRTIANNHTLDPWSE